MENLGRLGSENRDFFFHGLMDTNYFYIVYICIEPNHCEFVIYNPNLKYAGLICLSFSASFKWMAVYSTKKPLNMMRSNHFVYIFLYLQPSL